MRQIGFSASGNRGGILELQIRGTKHAKRPGRGGEKGKKKKSQIRSQKRGKGKVGKAIAEGREKIALRRGREDGLMKGGRWGRWGR